VKELDFLPQWYREGRRRQSHMRTQYVALVIIFFAMMTFNVTATHRASKAVAELAHGDGQRLAADGVTSEFSQITRQLSQLKMKADRIAQIDSRIDVAAVLAELSHLIGEAIVLNRVELVAEPFQPAQQKENGKGPTVRTVGTPASPERKASLEQVRFRVVVAGVAADPAQVADLVCKLDASVYFQHVHPSFSRDTKIQISAESAGAPEADKTATKATETLAVTEFEIICYLANYEDLKK
jgi:hypothetical protein